MSDRGRVDFLLALIFVGIGGIVAALLYCSAVSVAEQEVYARTRHSELIETGDGPAVLFSIPFLNEVITYPSGNIETRLPPAAYLTKSKVAVPIGIRVQWKVNDRERFHDSVGSSVQRAETRLAAYSMKSVRDVVGGTPVIDASSIAAVEREVTDALGPKVADLGIEITDIKIDWST